MWYILATVYVFGALVTGWLRHYRLDTYSSDPLDGEDWLDIIITGLLWPITMWMDKP